MTGDLPSMLVRMADQMGISLSKPISDVLVKFIGHIVKWNNKTNLVSRKTSGHGEVLRQVLDSLSLLRLGIEPDTRITDVGSGIGVPGMVLAVVRSDCRVRLVDSGERVCVLARRMAGLLDLQNVEVFQRYFPRDMDGIAKDTDFFVSKAFLSPPKWLAGIDRIVMHGTRVVVMTSRGDLQVPDDMRILKNDEFRLPGTNITRRNLLVEKL